MEDRLIQLITEWVNIAEALKIEADKVLAEDPHDSLAHCDLERADVYAICAEELIKVIKENK